MKEAEWFVTVPIKGFTMADKIFYVRDYLDKFISTLPTPSKGSQIIQTIEMKGIKDNAIVYRIYWRRKADPKEPLTIL